MSCTCILVIRQTNMIHTSLQAMTQVCIIKN